MRSNGNILGKVNTPTSSVASGRWNIDDLFLSTLSGSWPGLRYVVQTFTASGTWTCPAGVTEVEYLVIAGGGGAGGRQGGGGGAGGFRAGTGFSVTPGADYVITVGAGGAGGSAASLGSPGTNGQNSIFSTITSAGGGGGGHTNTSGLSGGSGGGGGSHPDNVAGYAGNGGSGGSGIVIIKLNQ